MSTLTVWKFNTADGADHALTKLEALQKQQLIQLLDAAVVSWPQGRKRPKTYQAMSTVGSGALGGAFWGVLFGLIFFAPLLGLIVGAAAGALSGQLTDYGINDNFINELKSKVTEGTSALFLLTGQVTVDKVAEAFTQDQKGELIQSNLSKEQEAKLREDFGSEV
ncbi:MAG: DUF1269 domain-containing protein [Chroococcidiopsidaceae cyanobacterium CP_BM_ER_R8_30]|nr:DUF1269 domain-containing protein [Chroococcidiopsidaceae cyanobacterium CP_BM_ER_R8_30]